MWPSVPKIIPEKQLGTAYSMIFWVQNWGLMGVPALIGWVLNKYCFVGYFAIMGTGFTTTQGDRVTNIATVEQQVYALESVGSISRKDTTVQVTRFIENAEGAISGILVSTGDTILRSQVSDKSFKKVQKKNEVKVQLYSFRVQEDEGEGRNVRIDHFITNKQENVTKYNNVASFYDYMIPMLIFTALGLLALMFAFLLKREDRLKGYGLQMPNIEKLIEH